MAMLPAQSRRRDPARTPNTLGRHLFSIYEQFRLDHLTPRTCTHHYITAEVDTLVSRSNGVLQCEEYGRSLEGRSIKLVSCGKGRKRVLLWSQMHGDEYTATLALMDIFNLLAHYDSAEKWMREMLDETTLFFIPMLNPDGAERRTRSTALGIDMNRDARVLATPEARLLRRAQEELRPQFGFNLHDQELASAGESHHASTIALLAPPADERRSTPLVRARAKRVAALLARVLGQFIPKNISTYPDDFEPRAFGDTMQALGTSTVLIESGHYPGDLEKRFVRKLNFVAILTALRCIGNSSYQDAELDLYNELPKNGKKLYDYIIRGIHLTHPSGWTHQVDIGLSITPNTYDDPPTVTVKDIGDLSTFGALVTVAANSRRVATDAIALQQSVLLPDLIALLQLPPIQ